MINKNVENYLNSLVEKPSNLLILYCKTRKEIIISIVLHNLFVTYSLFFMDLIIPAHELFLFGIVLSTLMVVIFSNVPFSLCREPLLIVMFVLIITLASLPFFSILTIMVLLVFNDNDFKNHDFNFDHEKNSLDFNEREKLFLKIVNNDDNCLTQLLSKSEFNAVDKALIEKVLSVKKNDKTSIETLKEIVLHENKHKLYVEND